MSKVVEITKKLNDFSYPGSLNLNLKDEVATIFINLPIGEAY